MGKLLLCAPNYVEDAIEPVVMGGGDWENSFPVTNVGAEFFIDNSISVNATTASTQMEFDFTFVRGLKFIGIPDSNLVTTTTPQIRVRGSTTIAWSGVTVNGVNSLAATTLNISTSIAITITAGEIFKIAGDTTLYQVVTGATIGASSTGSITIKQDNNGGTGLSAATVGSEILTCHSGDYTTPVFDTGTVTYFNKTVAVGQKVWGDAGVWDGFEPDSFFQKLNFPKQFIKILSSVNLVQYVKLEITDTTNADGNIQLDALYLTSVYEPSSNMQYGVSFRTISNTLKEISVGGVNAFERQRSGREVDLTLRGIPIEEAFTNISDIQRELDINGNMYFIYDQDDTLLLTRRNFPARFKTLGGISTQFFDFTESTHTIEERLA